MENAGSGIGKDAMEKTRRLAVVGFDSISLSFLDAFVKRGVMPTVGKLMESGCTTQTWPCFPMETATNWACLATGASPSVHGCNMRMPEPGGPFLKNVQAFPSNFCKAEQLWGVAHRVGKRSVIFDWAQSYPLPFQDGIVHVGEDGRPHYAIRALQECRAYTTCEIPESFHVKRVTPQKASGWSINTPDALEFEMPITPTESSEFWNHTLPCQYREVRSLYALIRKGENGYESVSVFGSKAEESPLFTISLNEWSDWTRHVFVADGQETAAFVRGKLLKLSPDAKEVHLYLSEIYPEKDFVHPAGLGSALLEACGPYIIQCSRQQVVISNAADIATYFEEQEYMGNWYRKAAEHILTKEEWDLFMFKWHGPDWTNHLAMYMIDPDHAMYDPSRADEGWRYWDRLMGLGDEIVKTVVEAAGEDAAIALVSDHGGATHYGGSRGGNVAALIKQLGLQGKVAGHGHYVHINTKERFSNGLIERGSKEYETIRRRLIEALLDAKDEKGRHAFRAVMPIEEAARFGVAGGFAGDIFVIPAESERPTKEEFLRRHPDPGTWDWPRLNSGAHSDDSYFIIAGPGVRQDYRRPKPTMITSVAPTLATVLGMPVPKDADGAVLWDFIESH